MNLGKVLWRWHLLDVEHSVWYWDTARVVGAWRGV